MKYVIGVDVGGTFTDLVCLDERGNGLITKTPSTPADPSVAIMNGISKMSGIQGKDVATFLRETSRITHGTTVSTNTGFKLTGAQVGLLTPRGFRDILGIRFGIRESPYDLTVPQPRTLCPRYLRIPIGERIDADGKEVLPLNEDDVLKACACFRSQGVEAVAICFLWSFKYPEHEKRALEICRSELPGVYSCASCEIQPEIREYWRMSTTVINAYVGPKLSNYLVRLSESLKASGFDGRLLITQSNAGVIFPEVAIEQAVRTVLSGPACAPAAAAYAGKPMGLKNVITVDMGGTSFDVCLIKDGKPVTALESAVGGVYHMKLPLVDVRTIGTGGGSVAWLDKMNVLHMGPQSAGADPGPACYGKGGREPTCTDADVILGYLDPDYYLGGEMKLYPDLARKAIAEKIALPLKMDVTEAAWSMKQVIDHHMIDGISIVSVQRGEDPGKYTLVVAGGAGASHAANLASVIGIKRMLIPKSSSVFCALGGVIADVRHDFVRSVPGVTRKINPGDMNEAYWEMKSLGDGYLEKEGVPVKDRYYRRTVDMRYKGQYHELEVPLTAGPDGTSPGGIDADIIAALEEQFHRMHESLYSYRDTAEIEILNLRLSAFGRVHTPEIKAAPFVGRDAETHKKGQRNAYFQESGGFTMTPVYDGETMEVGNAVEGPAIVELETTTIVVPPKASLELTPFDSFLVALT